MKQKSRAAKRREKRKAQKRRREAREKVHLGQGSYVEQTYEDNFPQSEWRLDLSAAVPPGKAYIIQTQNGPITVAPPGRMGNPWSGTVPNIGNFDAALKAVYNPNNLRGLTQNQMAQAMDMHDSLYVIAREGIMTLLEKEKSMLGRMIISSKPKPTPECDEIMAVPGLHLSFAREEHARRLLKEFVYEDVRMLAFDEETAKALFARSGYLNCQLTQSPVQRLFDIWSVSEGRDVEKKPRFRQVINGVIAAALGVPFWKDSGLWTTETARRYIEGDLSFDKFLGYSVLAGAIDNQKLVVVAQSLQNLDVEW